MSNMTPAFRFRHVAVLGLVVSGAAADLPAGERTTSGYAAAPAAFEHADSRRTSLFEEICGSSCWQDRQISLRKADVRFPGAYNLATDAAGDLYILESVAPSDSTTSPMVTKVDHRTLSVVWRTVIDDARGRWIYPGVVLAHANGDIYAVTGQRAVRIDRDSGRILAQTRLPGGEHPDDVAYNGAVVMPDGSLVTKSFYRLPGCKAEGFQAFLTCGSAAHLGSQLVVLGPERLDTLSVTDAPERIGGRITATEHGGRSYVYMPGQERVHRYLFAKGRLLKDAEWQPPKYRSEAERPGTAIVVFGDWILVQTNARFTRAPASLHAFHQDEPHRHFSIQPFVEQSPNASFIPSKPTADWINRRVYAVDGFGGTAAFDFDEKRGFRLAWRSSDRSLNFTTLTGARDDRLLASTAIDEADADVATMRYRGERLVLRKASSGAVLHHSAMLDPGPGLNIFPGADGVFYFLSIAGTLYVLDAR